jgi:hypothetical protein
MPQPNQNFKNHRQFVPGYHFITLSLILIGLIASIIYLWHTMGDGVNHYVAALITLVFIILGLVSWYLRVFALKAQDRAIRAEENFRHFVLTGKPLDSRLRLGQIIALRFASDAEYLPLIDKAINEQLKADDIKKAITNWRGDHHRA